MDAEFFEREFDIHDINGRIKGRETRLCFRLRKPSIADARAEPFVFEGEATARHKKDYAVAYSKFLKAKELAAAPAAAPAESVSGEVSPLELGTGGSSGETGASSEDASLLELGADQSSAETANPNPDENSAE